MTKQEWEKQITDKAKTQCEGFDPATEQDLKEWNHPDSHTAMRCYRTKLQCKNYYTCNNR